MEDLISVIIPVYNVKGYVGECLDSVINQSYCNLEIIVIDDGSTDGSEDICDKYRDFDNRIKVIHQPNKGLAAARNAGLYICNGKYICFIDSDDYIKKDYIEKLYNLIKAHNVKISICGIKELKDGVFFRGHLSILNSDNTVVCGKNCVFDTVVWNKMYDANLWKKTKFEEGKWFEDIYTTYQLLYNIENIAVTNEELYIYRKRKGSISANVFDIEKTRDYLEACKKRMHFFEDKEHYLYTKCIEIYLTSLRQHYAALFINSNKKYKNEIASQPFTRATRFRKLKLLFPKS